MTATHIVGSEDGQNNHENDQMTQIMPWMNDIVSIATTPQHGAIDSCHSSIYPTRPCFELDIEFNQMLLRSLEPYIFSKHHQAFQKVKPIGKFKHQVALHRTYEQASEIWKMPMGEPTCSQICLPGFHEQAFSCLNHFQLRCCRESP